MRDTLRSKEYFDEFILEEEEDEQEFEEDLSAGDIEEDRVLSVKSCLTDIKLGILTARYSRGDDTDSLRVYFESMLGLILETCTEFTYEDSIKTASLAYLLGVGENKLNELCRALSYTEDHDCLIDFILTGSDVDAEKISYKSYAKLAGAVSGRDKAMLIKYLRGWYKGSSGSEWYGTHKITDENLYYGYWCFEAAAVAKRLGFDDRDMAEEKYYPFDMAHFTE